MRKLSIVAAAMFAATTFASTIDLSTVTEDTVIYAVGFEKVREGEKSAKMCDGPRVYGAFWFGGGRDPHERSRGAI